MQAVRPRAIGRYVLADEIGCGGMGAVHLGYLDGPAGFSRTVAIKRLHAHLAKDPEFSAMLLDEARLAARITHPNVVATLDIVQEDGELLVVMEYVDGEALSRLASAQLAKGAKLSASIAVAIVIDVLHGLHGAHEATSASGAPLGIVHRDVSPQNVVVGRDGVARVLDFGVAKASSRIYSTRDGELKGKLAYMAPEQLSRGAIDRRVDVFAASIVLWEALTGTRLFAADHEAGTVTQVLGQTIEPPSARAAHVPPALDEIAMRGLSRAPEDRFATARDMATALEATHLAARRADVGEWVEQTAGEALVQRNARVMDLERTVRQATTSESAIPTDLLAVAPAQRQRDAPPSPRGRVPRRALVAMAVVAVVGVTGALAMRSRRAVAVAPAASTASAAIETPVERASAAAAPAIAPPDDNASTRAVAPPHATTRSHVTRPRPPASTPRKAPNCDPPYYFEADGAKHLKPECLR